MLLLLGLLSMAVLTSCQETVYDQNTCEDLSLKKFRGFPRAAHDFDTNCQSIKVQYTPEKCSLALGKLILGTEMSQLKTIYGERISQCFNQNDIDKFTR